MKLLQMNTTERICILTDYYNSQDGIIEGLESAKDRNRSSLLELIFTPHDLQDSIRLYQKLQEIGEHGSEIIVVHLTSGSSRMIVDICSQLGYFKAGFVWLFTDLADLRTWVDKLPLGVIMLESSEPEGIEFILQRTLQSAIAALNERNSIDSCLKYSQNFREAFYR